MDEEILQKSDLIEILCKKVPANNQFEIQVAANFILEEMTKALAAGNRIELRGFGTWHTNILAPKMGRNPKTGTKVALPSRCKILFRCSKLILDELNKG